MQVGMHIDVPSPEIALHQHLVLLHVSAADHQVVLTCDEPAMLSQAESLVSGPMKQHHRIASPQKLVTLSVLG